LQHFDVTDIVQAEPAKAENCHVAAKACKHPTGTNGRVNGTAKTSLCGEPLSINGRGVNRIASLNGHAPTNGNRVAGILETLGAVAEG